ncbi:MAG: hypothetical protein WBD57_14080 [Candidatus Cybelea sp.]
MTEREDELRQAVEAAQRFDMTPVEEAFSEIALSPLGRLIETVLPTVPESEMRTTLQRIRDLKSGTLDDLFDREFQSFLISYLRTDLSELQTITQVLRTQQLVSASAADENVQLAARGGDTGGISSLELQSILNRRRFT